MNKIPEVLRERPYVVDEVLWESPTIFTLRWCPEIGESRLEFVAGQWVYLQLLNEDGSIWGKAALSMANAPNEAVERLELGIKLARDFTRCVANLSPGDQVHLQGPFGVFVTQKPVVQPLVFVAGGIGVTPLRSMIRELLHDNNQQPMWLVYSNRYAEDAAYLEEFIDLARVHNNFHIVATLTGEEPAAWHGYTGRLTLDMLAPCLASLGESGLVYMCGPNSFMDDIRAMLISVGIDKHRIHQERFS